jgi:hypothetical protein
LSELADYRKSNGTAMFSEDTKKTEAGLGRQRNNYRLPGRKEIVYDLPVSSRWKHGFRMGIYSAAGERLSELDYHQSTGTAMF